MTEEVSEQRRRQKLEKAGIKVLSAAVRYSRSGRGGMTAASAVVWWFGRALMDRCDGNFIFPWCFIYTGAVV